jgi:dethiobiotin synthetase
VTVLVVAGTGTGVGKTVVVAAVAALARARGERVAVVKPAQTGAGPGESGDLEQVRRLAGVGDLHELARLAEPLAPATAARRASRPGVAPASVAAAVEALLGRDLVLIEGSGGLLVRFDATGGTIADVAAELGAPVLVVVRAGLGTLNEAALAGEALRARGLACPGVVVGAWPAAPDLAARCNLEDLPAYAGAPLLGRLPDGAGGMDATSFLAVARAGLAPALGGAAPPIVVRSLPEVHA